MYFLHFIIPYSMQVCKQKSSYWEKKKKKKNVSFKIMSIVHKRISLTLSKCQSACYHSCLVWIISVTKASNLYNRLLQFFFQKTIPYLIHRSGKNLYSFSSPVPLKTSILLHTIQQGILFYLILILFTFTFTF